MPGRRGGSVGFIRLLSRFFHTVRLVPAIQMLPDAPEKTREPVFFLRKPGRLIKRVNADLFSQQDPTPCGVNFADVVERRLFFHLHFHVLSGGKFDKMV